VVLLLVDCDHHSSGCYFRPDVFLDAERRIIIFLLDSLADLLCSSAVRWSRVVLPVLRRWLLRQTSRCRGWSDWRRLGWIFLAPAVRLQPDGRGAAYLIAEAF